ncbi:MAG: excinuclease ABC subunit UvrB [Candidatus Pacebacteria bacterium]|nr:excinuclease ABC subunit UvrB [Candidatus Paceibacterota bacterium]
MEFKLNSSFKPTGDQPQAIKELSKGVINGEENQVLLGVTGSGKTFTMANIIEKTQKPTLIIAHNKTLAAQLYQEFKEFFPDNAVSYFVSYYDYYQPEAYIVSSDTYIEKASTINEEIDRLRLSATMNLLTRKDTIIIASVSCIYNLGSPEEYGNYTLNITEGEQLSRNDLLLGLSNLQYERSDSDLLRGKYRVRGDIIQIWPAYEDRAITIDTLENKVTSLNWVDPTTGTPIIEDNEGDIPMTVTIYPAKHFMIDPVSKTMAMENIKRDLDMRVKELEDAGKPIEAYRLNQKVNYDLEMIREFGFTSGIENYTRYFDGRKPGDPPFTLIDYFKENTKIFNTGGFLTIVDESHMSVPQVRGMFNGDQARKKNLIDYGFRLPSALDNRPLQFHEFMEANDQFIYVSATPNEWEISMAGGKVTEQLVRPTGLLDPEVEIRPTKGQVENLIVEILDRKKMGQRVLVTTLTKKMSEALTDYLNDKEKIAKLVPQMSKEELEPLLPKVAYLHSDIDTMERSDILADLRKGVYDVIVGINLLREGLDLPEVTLVAILDADKEGFLRSRTSLIQTIGRAARHSKGIAILYADRITKSMDLAINETKRRREAQIKYNELHGITPTTIDKPIRERMIKKTQGDERKEGRGKKNNNLGFEIKKKKSNLPEFLKVNVDYLTPFDKKDLIKKLKTEMRIAATNLNFELAAQIRDKVKEIES